MTSKLASRLLAAACVLALSQSLALSADAPQRLPAPDRAIDAAVAAHAAQQHLYRLNVADQFTLGDVRPIVGDAGDTLAYCVDLQPAGYVVVCGTTVLPPVIAYSFTSDFGCDTGAGHPLADLLRWDLGARLDQAAHLPPDRLAERTTAWTAYLDPVPAAAERTYQQWPPAGTTPTGGWLTTNWTQNAPYNNLCPMDTVNNARSLAGCPAVAMSQIVNYHGRLNGTRFTNSDDYYHSYGGNNFWIDNDYQSRSFPSWSQLNTYMTTLFGNYFHGTTPTNTTKAALVYACGAACTQVYNAGGSGTFGVAQAFDGFQKFGCTTAALLDQSAPDLHARIAQNMMNAKPAHLAVVNAAWTVGHNLVIDGYRTDDYFHLNFGWGGSYNGWYQLLSGLPYELTVIEGVIVDIMTEPCAPMDCTCDGLINWDDFTYFRECFTGPGTGSTYPGCPTFDTDADVDVDLADFAAFQIAYNPSGT